MAEKTQLRKILKSGIYGLDEIMGGGIPKNSVIAVSGGTGSGRTIFVSQFLVKGVQDFSEPGLFLSFDEQKGAIHANMLSFDWDMAALEREHKIIFIEYPNNELSSFVEQESALKELIVTLGIKRVVIDSITPFSLLFSTSEERRLNTLRLFNAVKGWRTTTIITAEDAPHTDMEFPRTVSGIESFCDGYIHLSYHLKGKVREREIEIVKMRGCRHEHQIFPAYITNKGFSVGINEKSKKTSVR